MGAHVIKVPKRLDLLRCVQFVQSLRTLPKADEYIFDFERVDWIQPFAMLFLSSEIQRCRDGLPECHFTITQYKHMTYASHMGFFQAFRVEFGKAPGQASGSLSYIPITLFNCEQLREQAAENFQEVGETIESKSAELASVLAQEDSGILVDTLTYSFKEIMRNVVEHSESVQFGICAQYWPSKHTVEVGLIDRGIGIRNSLSQNPHLSIASDRDALKLALMPGISGKVYKGSRKRTKNHWANSGFGLYMTNRLCRNGGNFLIASGDSGLLLKGDKKEYVDVSFRGTALRMSLRTDLLTELYASLERFRKEGFKIAKKFGLGASLTASTASQMLSRDFGKS